jgi:fido (protein-threonine AMPylation protein)
VVVKGKIYIGVFIYQRTMVYIYRKVIGNKEYYYLRASIREKDRIITKDIAYLGSDLGRVREQVDELPKKYHEQIRKTYKTIQRFLDINSYREQAKEKLPKGTFLSPDSLLNIEAAHIHYQTRFPKKDPLTQQETWKEFIIEFAFNTTSIEGNTITLKEAAHLLVESRVPKDKTLREIYDLQNTEKTFNSILRDAPQEITHDLIQDIHRGLLANIDNRNGYRTDEVRVFKAAFASTPAPYVMTDMELFLKWTDTQKDLHPFVRAVIFHHKFEKIHPFMDGNGRTGRMLMNVLLLSQSYPPLIIRKKNRPAYLDALHRADKSPPLKAEKEHYADLLEFTAKEYAENYWHIFL